MQPPKDHGVQSEWEEVCDKGQVGGRNGEGPMNVLLCEMAVAGAHWRRSAIHSGQ
jgi:hypothetical protein